VTRLTILIIAIFAVITTAWAGDYQNRTTLEYYLSPGEYEEIMQQIHDNAPSTEGELSTNDIADILQRCLEFVDDNTEDSIGSYTALAIYQPMDRESLQRRSIQEAQERLKKLERETALRREIERALRVLRGRSDE